jgi:hypothetical protein
MSYYKTRLLDNLPDQDFPVEVFSFLTDLKESTPSKKFLADGRKNTNDPSVIQIAHFGNKIWNRADEVRKNINGSINPLWVYLTRSKSGSGHNFNAVVEGIRLVTWPIEVTTRAQTNTKTQLSRLRAQVKAQKRSSSSSSSSSSFASFSSQNPQDNEDVVPGAIGGGGGGSGVVGTVDDTEDDDFSSIPAYKEIYSAQYKKIFVKEKVDQFYPTYWLTFLLIGRPAMKDGRPVLEAGIISIYYLLY